MTGNPHFPDPRPSLGELETACEELQEVLAAVYEGGSKLDYTRKQLRTEKVADTLKALASYVSFIAQGDPAIVLSAGFEQRKPSRKISAMEAPRFPKSKTSNYPCTIDLRWTPVHGARMYKVYGTKSNTNNTGFEVMLETSNSRCTVEGLEPMEYYTFRIEAIGAHTVSPLSQITTAVSIGQRAA